MKIKKKHKRFMKPTLSDVIRIPELANTLDLGEMLALAGLKLEIECDGQSEEFNAEVTRLANQFRKKQKVQ